MKKIKISSQDFMSIGESNGWVKDGHLDANIKKAYYGLYPVKNDVADTNNLMECDKKITACYGPLDRCRSLITAMYSVEETKTKNAIVSEMQNKCDELQKYVKELKQACEDVKTKSSENKK